MADPLLISAIAKGAFDILKEVFEDKDEANRLSHEIATKAGDQAHSIQLAQIKVNQEQAKSTNWFVAGGRPAIIWVGALALLNNYILKPWVDTALMWGNVTYTIATTNTAGEIVEITQLAQMPHIGLGELIPLVAGLLGLGAFRSYEKSKGVAREQ